MKIKDILAKGQPTLSFEVFPPKEESNFASVEKAALEIAKLNPSFMSVTYGAGGGTSQYTVQIASDIQSTCQVPALSHLTCVSSTREKVHSVLREIQAHGIENVLALRGDIPKDVSLPATGATSPVTLRILPTLSTYAVWEPFLPFNSSSIEDSMPVRPTTSFNS